MKLNFIPLKLKIILPFTLFFILKQSFSQTDKLIKLSNNRISQLNNSEEEQVFEKTKQEFLIKKNNIIKMPFVVLMVIYRNNLSIQFSASCPYKLSCSRFASRIIAKNGVLKGIAYSIDRLHRCNKHAYNNVLPIYIDNSTGDIIDDPSDY